MENVNAKITPKLIAEIDNLVKEGWYASRSEAIRDAIRILVEKKKYSKMRIAMEEDINWGLNNE